MLPGGRCGSCDNLIQQTIQGITPSLFFFATKLVTIVVYLGFCIAKWVPDFYWLELIFFNQGLSMIPLFQERKQSRVLSNHPDAFVIRFCSKSSYIGPV